MLTKPVMLIIISNETGANVITSSQNSSLIPLNLHNVSDILELSRRTQQCEFLKVLQRCRLVYNRARATRISMLYIYVRVLSKAIGKFAAKVNTYFSTREFRVNLYLNFVIILCNNINKPYNKRNATNFSRLLFHIFGIERISICQSKLIIVEIRSKRKTEDIRIATISFFSLRQMLKNLRDLLIRLVAVLLVKFFVNQHRFRFESRYPSF